MTFEDGSKAAIGESPESPRPPRAPIFSMRYGGQSFAEILPQSRLNTETEALPGYKLHAFTYAMPDQLLTCIPGIRDCWFAYQMHHPTQNAGFALACRRDQCPCLCAELSLPGECWACSGAELMAGGLRLTLPKVRASQMVFYEWTN